MEARHRAGEPIDDLCRACHTERRHTVMVVDAAGQVLRVVCDFCGSQHNYRHGGGAAPAGPRLARPDAVALPLVSERERTQPPMSLHDETSDIELLLRRIIREEAGVTPVVPAARWRGGQIVLRPGTPGLQEKVIPIDALFHKIVMIRNRLRTLEQQVNASDLPDDQKVKLQAYVTACYGSLTSFNVLFADADDHFVGASGE
jgi:hypothetical protein